MSTKRRKRIKSLICPDCATIGSIREIAYGLPLSTFDFEKYAVGGCCIAGDGSDPEIQCRHCDWRGFRKELD